MQKNKRKFFLVSVSIILFLFIYYYFRPIQTRMHIGKTVIKLDLALTDNQKIKGLGGRKSLNYDRGMLFVYPNPDYYQFWMKDMNFNLDFIWIKDNTIVDITENVPIITSGEITKIVPNVPVNKILEVKSGFVDKNGIKVGDNVVIRN